MINWLVENSYIVIGFMMMPIAHWYLHYGEESSTSTEESATALTGPKLLDLQRQLQVLKLWMILEFIGLIFLQLLLQYLLFRVVANTFLLGETIFVVCSMLIIHRLKHYRFKSRQVYLNA